MTDDLAAEIVGRCRERLDAGEDVDVDAVLRAHPEIAATLRERLDALARLDRGFGRVRAPVDAAAASLVGRALGAWRLVSVLGTGGMGTVFVAEDGAARVAVKVIHAHLLARSGFFKRFLREAEIGKRIRHENVVATLDAGEVDVDGRAVHFLVMEHVEGRTLRELLAELGRVPEELCRHVGREVAKALVAIHAAGAVHRDLKPDNVLITKDDTVKVMDLGVARLADEAMRLSQTGAFIGSVRYAAPEQFGGPAPRSATSEASSAKGVDEVDGRADLYALGLTLYELATGRHPFECDDFRVVVRQQMTETPRPAGEVNPQISPFFEEVLRRLLEKDRDARFETATALLAVLEEGEGSSWWQERAKSIRADTRRPLRRIRIPRETALYGRDSELAKLSAIFERVRCGEGQVVLIEGEAGIGKSRLIDEYVALLHQQGHDVNFLYGSYPPGGAATASGAFTSAYREHLGDDETSIRAALPQTPLLVPAFAALLRGDVAPSGTEPLTKSSLQTVFVHATRSFAAQRPTIVLIDDLHFAPDEGRALFASLALAVPGHRILLVGTARPEIDAGWIAQIDRSEHVSHIRLPRLGPKDLVLLLRDSLRSEHLAEELAAKIAVKSDGNPFFVFEILRGLRDGQFITRKPDGTWATTKLIAEIEVPDTVKDLIFARVGSLATQERNLLDVAACAGFKFDPVLVGEVLHLGRIPVLQRLAAVEKSHRLVRSVGRRFVFDHHQIAEVLYAGLPEILREEYHAAIGAALEAKNDATSKEPKDLEGALCVDLAEHFLKGAQGQRGLRYLEAALDHLEKSYLNDAAVRLADRALAVPGPVAGNERTRTLLRLGYLFRVLGRRSRQEEVLREAECLADAAGDDDLRGQAATALGILFRHTGRNAEAESSYRRALKIARSRGDKSAEAGSTVNLGSVYSVQGHVAEAQGLFESGIALCREAGSRQFEAVATTNLGDVMRMQGHIAEARQCVARALAIHRAIRDRSGEAFAARTLGGILYTQGHLAEAREYVEQCLTLAREFGDRRQEATAMSELGVIVLSLGRIAEAWELANRSFALAQEIGDRLLEGFALRSLADVAAEKGDVIAAERLLAEELELRRVMRQCDGEAVNLEARGALLSKFGRSDEARVALSAALAITRDRSVRVVELLATARLATLCGDVAAALAAVAAHEVHVEMREAMEARFLIWQATRDPAHLAEAKRRLDFLVEHAPPDCRETMLANVRLHREIAAAAREEGLPLAADSSRGSDERAAPSAGA